LVNIHAVNVVGQMRLVFVVSLAQTLWKGIEAGLRDADEHSAATKAIQRDEELSSGSAAGRAHPEVMKAARRAIGCE
jgi:hypothetical protein